LLLVCGTFAGSHGNSLPSGLLPLLSSDLGVADFGSADFGSAGFGSAGFGAAAFGGFGGSDGAC
jgi:hypothetical protein